MALMHMFEIMRWQRILSFLKERKGTINKNKCNKKKINEKWKWKKKSKLRQTNEQNEVEMNLRLKKKKKKKKKIKKNENKKKNKKILSIENGEINSWPKKNQIKKSNSLFKLS